MAIDGYTAQGFMNILALTHQPFSPEECINIYARLVKNYVLWRIVLAMDQVYRYYQSNGVLPDRIEAGNKEWPLDLFNDKPLRYNKTGKNGFTIYSVGPDEKDNNGQHFNIGNPVDIDEPLDVGIRITE